MSWGLSKSLPLCAGNSVAQTLATSLIETPLPRTATITGRKRRNVEKMWVIEVKFIIMLVVKKGIIKWKGNFEIDRNL